jgi:hypothetical protein
MRNLVVWALALMLALAVAGCERKKKDGLFEESGPLSEKEKVEVLERVADLANGADMEDPDAEATFHEAIQDLTLRGSSIEYLLIEHLAEDEDWAVRYGIIHVLDSVGTRSSIEPLIAALADPHHLVSYKALHSLRVMADHREIPEEGLGANGLPAVPPPAADDLDVDAAFKPWIIWHRDHASDLRDAWRVWWKTEGGSITIE